MLFPPRTYRQFHFSPLFNSHCKAGSYHGNNFFFHLHPPVTHFEPPRPPARQAFLVIINDLIRPGHFFRLFQYDSGADVTKKPELKKERCTARTEKTGGARSGTLCMRCKCNDERRALVFVPWRGDTPDGGSRPNQGNLDLTVLPQDSDRVYTRTYKYSCNTYVLVFPI